MDPDPVLRSIKIKILQASAVAQEGHIPSAFSILDIIWALYHRVMKIDADQTANSDKFVLSKGHGSLALYGVLDELGLLDESPLWTFGQFGSALGGHPDRVKIKSVEASTGSLGHGLPFGVGIALAKKIGDNLGDVYVLIGDGESNEGSIWEAALIASHRKLSNLVCLVDANGSSDRALRMEPLAEKFEAFGWHVIRCDGPDAEQIVVALTTRSMDRPIAVIANTKKGNGLQEMENNPAWHHGAPKDQELVRFIEVVR